MHHVTAKRGEGPLPGRRRHRAGEARCVGARKRAVAAPLERDDTAVVRVHIGRLDVRANLQEAPKRLPSRAHTRPEGLSLSDYLRGRREAG